MTPRIDAPLSRSFDAVAMELAGRQHGVVTRRQLQAAGIGRTLIDRRIGTGVLRAVHRGVYLLGPVEAPLGREQAAVLACSPGAFLRCASAAHVWGLTRAEKRPHPLQVGTRVRGRRRPGIEVRSVGTLEARDLTRVQGIPTTTPPRTLCDLAAEVHPGTLERAIAEAMARGLTTMAELRDLAREHAGRPGIGVFREVLEGDVSFTRSKAEGLFLRLVRQAGMPGPRVNARVAGHEVDFFWPDRRLAVEVDGRAFHVSPRAFERDRLRDAELDAEGVRVVRVTWRQLESDREALLFRLGRSFAVGGDPVGE